VDSYRSLEKNTRCQSDKFVSLSKWRILNRLHDRNETLYYRVSLMMKLACGYENILQRLFVLLWDFYLAYLFLSQVLIRNIKEFAPIIYTPTVGLVCENYSGLFRRPRGMYFSAKDKGEMMSMIYNWPSDEVLNSSW